MEAAESGSVHLGRVLTGFKFTVRVFSRARESKEGNKETDRQKLCFGYIDVTRLKPERARGWKKARCTNDDAIIFTHWERNFDSLHVQKTKKPTRERRRNDKGKQ